MTSYNHPPRPLQARTPLPPRHAAETLTVIQGGRPVTITVGFYSDGTPGEVFIDVAKIGTDLAHVAHDAAVAISLALQYGVDIESIRHAVARDSNGTSLSILGAVVDAIAGVPS